MKNIEEQEIWKPYPDYPFIEANQFGEIRIRDRVITRSNGSKYFAKGHVLKQRLRKDGYMDIQFQVNGKKVRLYAHRIVAASHLPNPDNLPEVNHIDCNRANNAVSNLEWCTHQENIAHCVELGRWANNNPGHPVIAINIETFEVFWFESQHEAARKLGVDQSSITKVIKGKLHRISGFWFCNADEKAIEKTRAKFSDKVAYEVEKLISDELYPQTNETK